MTTAVHSDVVLSGPHHAAGTDAGEMAVVVTLETPGRPCNQCSTADNKELIEEAAKHIRINHQPLNRVANVSGRRSLRSSGTNRLVVPPFRLSTVGSRAFPVVAAKT